MDADELADRLRMVAGALWCADESLRSIRAEHDGQATDGRRKRSKHPTVADRVPDFDAVADHLATIISQTWGLVDAAERAAKQESKPKR